MELNCNVLIKDRVKVEWSELGEGLCGDYNPDDPDDIELLRFDVSELINGEWEMVDDASYCTQMPVSTTPKQRQDSLKWIMSEVYDGIMGGYSIKKICEFLSWISPESLKENKITKGKFFQTKGG
jgi:hypothetical protein